MPMPGSGLVPITSTGGKVTTVGVFESDGEVCAAAIAGRMIAAATARNTLRRATFDIVCATDETRMRAGEVSVKAFYMHPLSRRERIRLET